MPIKNCQGIQKSCLDRELNVYGHGHGHGHGFEITRSGISLIFFFSSEHAQLPGYVSIILESKSIDALSSKFQTGN